MRIPRRVHPLIGRHSQAKGLIHLANRETSDPHKVKQCLTSHEEHPRIAHHKLLETRLQRRPRVQAARGVPHHVAAVRHEAREGHEEEEEVRHEVLVVLGADAVGHPGAVVVELGHALITDGAMLGAEGLADEAGGAEESLVEALPLRELDDGAVFLVLRAHLHISSVMPLRTFH